MQIKLPKDKEKRRKKLIDIENKIGIIEIIEDDIALVIPYKENVEYFRKEAIKRIEKAKDKTRKETGAFKYDFAYDECLKIIKKI